MPGRPRGLPTLARRPIVLGLVGVAALAVAYPIFDEQTQRPLGIFVLPILVVAALGSWPETLVVGAAAMVVAGIEGSMDGAFDSTGLVARLAIMAVIWAVGIVVAWERQRREQLIDATTARGILLDAFQDSLVPEPIPPPRVLVRTRYLPGDERLLLGGDFFDAIRLPNRSLGYIIGDVCGHGPRAAAFGAALRSGWKTLATTTPTDPLHWVKGLEETFFRLGRHSDTFVTVNTGYVVIGDGAEWCFVSAGHPWPIVISHDVEMVEPIVGPPLGVGAAGNQWKETCLALPDGCTVVLYTDGLIENVQPDKRRDDGEALLLRYLRTHGLDLDHLLRTFGPEGFHDDVAVVSFSLT